MGEVIGMENSLSPEAQAILKTYEAKKEADEYLKKHSKKRVNGNKKGKTYECEIANQLAHIFPKARRHLEYHSEDALKKMDIQGTLPWVIQCKRKAKYENPKTLLETLVEEGEHRVLVTKADKLPDLAIVEWKVLKMLIEIAHGLREPIKSIEQVRADKEKLNIKKLPPFNNGCREELGL